MHPPHRPPRTELINFGGASLYKMGTARVDLADPYALAITMRWPAFFVLALAGYGVFNALFAWLYELDPHAIANARPGVFRDAFFFSMETMATVGYGTMSPSSTYGHVISGIEIVFGLTFTAIVTGIIFVRFSKVQPKVLFADKLVVCQHEGRPTLMLRLAYGRAGMLASAHARMHMLVSTTTLEGRPFRSFRELKLMSSELPLVMLGWTLMHVIDEDSPLHALDAAQISELGLRPIVTFEARDYSLASPIFAAHVFEPSQLHFGEVYEDLIAVDEHQARIADLRKLSLTRPE